MRTKEPFTVEVRREVTSQRVEDLLCCAFEGGANYWYMIESCRYPVGTGEADHVYPHLSVPMSEGGAVIISCKEGDEVKGAKEWSLDREAIRRGLRLMAELYPAVWAAFVEENADGTTGDVFLQICLFGKIVFGLHR